MKPYKEASIFWHNVWKRCGSPRNAAIADVMRRARATYHIIVKQVKRDQNTIKRNKMDDAILCDDTRSFWNEVRTVSSNKNNTLPNMIDGKLGNENISDVFVAKYISLYNSVSYGGGGVGKGSGLGELGCKIMWKLEGNKMWKVEIEN